MNRCLAILAALFCAHGSTLAAPWRATPQPDLQEKLQRAPKLKIVDVVEPVKTTTVANQWWIPNPGGRTYDFLQWYYKGYKDPTTAVIADLGTRKVQTLSFRTGKQINAAGVATARDGRVFISSPGAGGVHIFIYDPRGNTLTETKTALPHLGDAQRLTVGTDGLIYGAGSDHRKGRVGCFRIDPETGKLTDLGPIGPPATYAMSLAVDDTHLYVVTRRGTWSLVAADKKTLKWTELLKTTPQGTVFVYQKRYGCHSQGRGFIGLSDGPHHFWLHRGKAIEHADHSSDWPWKEPRAESRKPPVKPDILAEKLVPDNDGKAALWFRYDGKRDWTQLPFQVPLYPVNTHRLLPLPDGRMFGKAGFYHGEFLFDPKTGKAEYVGRSGVSYNCAAIVHDGIAYVCGYSSSRLASLDPNRPIKHVGKDPAALTLPIDKSYNPRILQIMRQHTGTHTMTDAAVGADGRIYFCGNSYRDTNRGGLGWWDPKTETAGGVWEPFSNVAISYMASVADGACLVMSTFPKKDTELGKPTPKLGKLMVWDVKEGKVVREIEPIPDAQWTGMILGLDDRRVLGLTKNPADAKTYFLYGVDATTGEVAFRKLVPNPEVQIRPHSHQGKYRYDLFPAPDGWVYTFMQHRLVRINPENAFVEVVGYIGAPGDMVFVGKDLYMAGATAVRRIPGVLK